MIYYAYRLPTWMPPRNIGISTVSYTVGGQRLITARQCEELRRQQLESIGDNGEAMNTWQTFLRIVCLSLLHL